MVSKFLKEMSVKDIPFTKKIERLLIKHEGLKLTAYKCPAGKLTIGVGRNLDDMGLSESELEYIGRDLNDVKLLGITSREAIHLLRNDIVRCIRELKEIFDDYDALPEVVKIVMIDMVFNLGKSRFLHFKKMIQAVKDEDWEEMVRQMKDSRWCEQVKSRCGDNEMFIREFMSKSVS